MGWVLKKTLFDDITFPEYLINHMDTKCPCGFDILVSDNLKKERCANPSCPYHMAVKVEIIVKALGVKGIGPETSLSLVKSLRLNEAIEIIPKYLKIKPKLYLWQIAKLSRFEGIDSEWASVLDGVESMEDAHKVPAKYRDFLPDIFDNAQYFEVIQKRKKENVCIAVHKDLTGFNSREEFVDKCNNTKLCQVNTILKTSVSRYTKFLVTESPNDGSTKVKKAKTTGVSIITPSEYIDYLVERSIALGIEVEPDISESQINQLDK